MFYISFGSKYHYAMKTMRYFLACVVILLVAGCSTTFRPWSLSEIKEGMDRDQVVRILGNPDSTEFKNGGEHLHYLYQEDRSSAPDSVPFYDQNSELAFRDLNNRRIFKQYEYVVILVDGKVINYKEL